MPNPSTKPIDLVLAGGGVKGIGLAGTWIKLMEAGYRAYRVAGSLGGVDRRLDRGRGRQGRPADTRTTCGSHP